MIASKVNALKRIVDCEFSINLNHKKTRSRYVSQGIRVFSKILYDKGVSKTSIAKSLGKNHATILHQLGLDHEKLTFRFQGRDYRLTDVHGHVVQDLIA